MVEHIQFGSKKIKFRLEYSNRKTLGIQVTPEMNVLVKAPFNVHINEIKERICKKAPWILKQQSYFLGFHPKTTPRKYVGGETHLYLGKQYRLLIHDDELESVKLKGQYIEISTKNKTQVKELLEGWYQDKAKIKFDMLSLPLIEQFKKYHVKPSSIILREMPKRWGSCTPNGKIILNPELIKAPKRCIEYVIIHELCHLIHHDHTQKFFNLQTKEMRDWEKWKLKLETLLA